MSRDQSVIAALALAAFVEAGCDRIAGRGTSTTAGTVTLVNRVQGDVRCVKGPSCESAVAAALRQRLNSVAITTRPGPIIDLEFEQSATAFSSASFRQAVGDGGGEVLKIGIEACGTVDTVSGQSWITSGSTRLLLDGPGSFDNGTDICVTGELRDEASPPRLLPGRLGF